MSNATSAILVAGGAGYIGSHTAKVLAQQGVTPVVIDNLVTGNRWAAKFGPFVESSIGSSDQVAEAVRRYNITGAILFAAHAYVGESTSDPSKYYRNNLTETINFLDALRNAGVKRLVFSSSCSIYGMQRQMPIAEDASKDPLSPYAETKLIAEKILNWYDRAYGLHYVALRYFNAAGADPEGEIGECHDPETHLIPLAIAAATDGPGLKIFGTDYPTPDGTALRDYIHVTDLADAHVRALRYLEGGGASIALNCGTGEGSSVQEVVDAVTRVSGRAVRAEFAPRREGDAPALVADGRKIREVLGWSPKYSSLDRIVETAWKWSTEGLPRQLAVRV
jgi:UDP-arabinose 4-epimerase